MEEIQLLGRDCENLAWQRVVKKITSAGDVQSAKEFCTRGLVSLLNQQYGNLYICLYFIAAVAWYKEPESMSINSVV